VKRSGGDKQDVYPYITNWLKKFPEEKETQFLIVSWLDAVGEKEVVEDYLKGCLKKYPEEKEVEFVIVAWLKAGGPRETIEEYFGRVNSREEKISIARMKSPCGWSEPGQTPEFDEYTVVLKGTLQIETRAQIWKIHARQAIVTLKGEWIRYSTPEPEGAEYISVCLPAFSPSTVHRD